MADPMEAGPLPDYERPPLVETILGVQFDRLPGFRNAHLGAFWKSLDTAKWPTVVDAPPLASQFERFTEAARWAKGLQLQVSQDPSSRLQIRNKNDDRMIQVQNGRLHFNWLGESGGTYPRYRDVRDGFRCALQDFVGFVRQEAVGDFLPNQWEVTYLNLFAKGTVWNTVEDWSFFRLLAPIPTIEELVYAENFTGEWHFQLPDERGRLHVSWQHAKKPEPSEEGDEVVRLALTARGPLPAAEDQLQAILEGVDLGRTTIVRSFKSFMGDDANHYWGIKNAGN